MNIKKNKKYVKKMIGGNPGNEINHEALNKHQHFEENHSKHHKNKEEVGVQHQPINNKRINYDELTVLPSEYVDLSSFALGYVQNMAVLGGSGLVGNQIATQMNKKNIKQLTPLLNKMDTKLDKVIKLKNSNDYSNSPLSVLSQVQKGCVNFYQLNPQVLLNLNKSSNGKFLLQTPDKNWWNPSVNMQNYSNSIIVGYFTNTDGNKDAVYLKNNGWFSDVHGNNYDIVINNNKVQLNTNINNGYSLVRLTGSYTSVLDGMPKSFQVETYQKNLKDKIASNQSSAQLSQMNAVMDPGKHAARKEEMLLMEEGRMGRRERMFGGKKYIKNKLSTKKSITKKPVSKKPTTKKTVSKKPSTKKPKTKKPLTKKITTKKPVSKKPKTKKAPAKK